MEKLILSLESYNTKVVWEASQDAGCEEVIYAFAGLMITQTYNQSSIIEAMKSYIETYDTSNE